MTLRAVATSLEIPIRGGTVRAEGDLDFRGTLGVDKRGTVGFRSIRLTFDLDADATTSSSPRSEAHRGATASSTRRSPARRAPTTELRAELEASAAALGSSADRAGGGEDARAPPGGRCARTRSRQDPRAAAPAPEGPAASALLPLDGPGGLDVMSSTTRLTSRISLIMREAICSSRSYGRRAQSAVIASSLVTARITTT